MSTKFPVVSLEVMKNLFPDHSSEADDLAAHGLWFYSVPDDQFLSYIPNINLCVNDVEPVRLSTSVDDVNFNLRLYGSVYEVTVSNGFPSSFLLSSNMVELTENYLDVTDNLYVAILNSLTTPILLGSRKALDRLLNDSYKMFSVKKFIEERN
jgi:hypothetical protein